MKKMQVLLSLSLLSLFFVGCQDNPLMPKEEEKYEIQDEAEVPKVEEEEETVLAPEIEVKKESLTAFCLVQPKSGSKVVGGVKFTEVEGGVRIVADVSGLKPGLHGFHVHEHGDCSAQDGASAGGHYNPTDMAHGGPDSAIRHVGDLGNLEANEHGFAHYDRVDTVITLEGPHSIVGKSIVIHEDADDFTTQPTGNSGKRVACGEIYPGTK